MCYLKVSSYRLKVKVLVWETVLSFIKALGVAGLTKVTFSIMRLVPPLVFIVVLKPLGFCF